MPRWVDRLNERKEDVRRNLESLVEELDAPEWDRAEKVHQRLSDRTPEADLATVHSALHHTAFAYSQRKQPSTKVVSVIERMCGEYGVDAPLPFDAPQPYDVDGPSAFTRANLAFLEQGRASMPTELAQAEFGYVGTPMRGGRVQKERAGKYSAFTVRGSSGNPGLYEEYWASETQIYDAVQGHISGLVSGDWSLRMPKYVAPGQRGALQEFIDYHNARMRQVRCMQGGFRTFIMHAGSMIPLGFALFEPVFARDRAGRWYWKRAGFREQPSVDKWYSSERGDRIVGVDFRTTSDNARSYSLPSTDDFRTNHVLWIGMNAFGANWEGRPPTRPAVHWVRMKRLIAQIVPLAAEKWGVPIGYIRSDPQYLQAVVAGAGFAPPKLNEAYEAFKDARAVEGPIFKFADGVIADVVAPPGEMPGLDGWIQYCDQMISYGYSNEGNLLGMQAAVGSYAQAEVKERRFLRSAPGYAWPIAEAMTCHIYGPLAESALGEELVEPPEVVYSPDPATDRGEWLNNARQLFGPNKPVDEWPEPYQERAHQKMDVDMRSEPSLPDLPSEP